MFSNQEQNYWAGYNANEQALIIQTWSGFGRYAMDYLFPPRIFPLDTDNETLGTAVLQALANSRTFVYNSPEDQDFFDNEKSHRRYESWVSSLCETLGYKTRRALFKNMMGGSIYLNNGRIEISSTRHVKLEAWEGIGVEDVVLSLDTPPKEIGAGLKLALSRCR